MPNASTGSSGAFVPETPEQALALELAEQLQDTRNLPCYLSLVQQFREEHLRRAATIARETPRAQIKKSRGALFVYLVKHLK